MRLLLISAVLISFLTALKAKEKEVGAGSFGFGLICLGKVEKPDLAALEKSVRKSFALKASEKVGVVIDGDNGGSSSSSSSSSYRILIDLGDSGSIIAMSAGFPIPEEEIKYACANSHTWLKAHEVLSEAKDHLIVIISQKETDKVARALFLSRSLAALAEASNAIAIYNGNGSTVDEPENYALQIPRKVDTAADVPASLWVGYLLEKHPDESTSLYTTGLKEFGCKELEVVRSKRLPSEIWTLIHGVSKYLIFAGDIIEDGNTVGGSEGEKFRVRVRKSQINPEDDVLQIEF